MSCQNCNGKKKLYHVSAKCSDLYSQEHIGGKYMDGYVPTWISGDMGEDYINFIVCRHCGHMQGDWPNDNEQANQFKSGKAVS